MTYSYDRRIAAKKPEHTPASASNLSAFMSEYTAGTHSHPMNGRQRMLGYGPDDWIILELKPFAGRIHISWMQIMPGSERKGFGLKTLLELTDMADKHHVQMDLQAIPTGEPKVPKGKLKALYRRVGFVSVRGDVMVYDPKGGVE